MHLNVERGVNQPADELIGVFFNWQLNLLHAPTP